MVSLRSQIKLQPRPDWSPLGVEFKCFDQHPPCYHKWVSPLLPRRYDCLPPTNVMGAILEWCHVLFTLFTIRDTSFLLVLRFSSLLKNRRNIFEFQFGPHGNDNVIQSNLVIVICFKMKIHASSTQIVINYRGYYYSAALPTQMESCVRARFPLRRWISFISCMLF